MALEPMRCTWLPAPNETAGNLEDALKLVGQAIELNESVRGNVSGETLRASFLETVRLQYELKIALLVALHREVEAFEASELRRARSLLELLRESQVDFRQGVDPVLLAKERSLHLRLRAKATRQVQMLSDKHTDAQAAAAEKEINNLTMKYEQVESEIREKSPAYAALTQPRTLHAADIQKQVLDPNTLLLEYVLGDEESFLWAITPASLSTYKLPKSSKLDAAARRAYQAFSTAGSTDNHALIALSRIVLGPVSTQLGTKRVVVVADGALHFVVASLWRVPDLATAELMNWFYKGMLVDGLRPAAAIRQAQVTIWHDGRWARPYYWAAFTMQGDWR